MAELVTEGKVRYLGLSEVTATAAPRVRRAPDHRGAERVLAVDPGRGDRAGPSRVRVGRVPYSPLGRGFLTGTVDLSALDGKDFRRRNPRFTGEARSEPGHRRRGAPGSRRLGVEPAQVALAWVYAQQERLGVNLVPIPGTKRVKWLEQNVAALDVTLTPAELTVLDPLATQVVGTRY